MRVVPVFCLVLGASIALPLLAAPRKVHTATLGATKKVAYSKSGDPAGAAPGENSLKVRPLVVDGSVKDWTTGDLHNVTDRSFVVRRALRINDELPGEKPVAPAGPWVWQRGPWLLVDRATGHVTAVKLPDYDPAVSQVTWFRDYAAYCGLTPSGKSLYAVVAQLSARKPVLSKKLDSLKEDAGSHAPCAPPEWQREPLRVTFHPAGKDAVSFEVVTGSAVLIEDSTDDADAAKTKQD
jgi:hypothetical protein